MYVLAIIDTNADRRNLKQLLENAGVQVDFAGSEEDFVALCRQTEPDTLLFKSHYDDVSARFLLKHLSPDDRDVIPERILVLSTPDEGYSEQQISSGISAHWIMPELLLKYLSGDVSELSALGDSEELPSKKVLHISDDRLIRRIVSDMIASKTSYELKSAPNGREGLALYQDFKPHLILTDWDLPDIDGIELCRHIKTELMDTHVVIALFSSMTDEHLIEEAYKAHAKAYILKPVKPELLLSKIIKMVESV